MTQFTDKRGRRTLADFVPIREVYAAGRLDFDSEGLLVLTSNGQLQQRLSDPRFEHPKTYWVQVEGEVTAQALEALRGGVTVQEYRTKPCEATSMAEPHWPERDPPIRMRKTIPTSWIEITLREGRNRQVRRMTAAVGFPTLRLIRIGIGPIALGDLAPGGWRDLTESEMRAILRIPPGAP